ncbi:MAG: hypothetical protein ACPIOQ_26690, partial [Promethearchaeia archaeon]
MRRCRTFMSRSSFSPLACSTELSQVNLSLFIDRQIKSGACACACHGVYSLRRSLQPACAGAPLFPYDRNSKYDRRQALKIQIRGTEKKQADYTQRAKVQIQCSLLTDKRALASRNPHSLLTDSMTVEGVSIFMASTL